MYPEVTDNFVSPEAVISHFHIKEGDVVADFGAGSGAFLKGLSVRVGSGKVYACEIQKGLVEKMGDYARSQNLGNVYPLWCDLEELQGIPVQSNALDVGILVNTLFLLEDKITATKEFFRTIRAGGRIIVIDWSDSYGGLGPAVHQVCDAQTAKSLFEANGFVFERSFPAGAHHYGLAFRKV
jgi:ubiquinone/menaquinone biosynthesis C-methylase UbiE